jgi:hypothetical protein
VKRKKINVEEKNNKSVQNLLRRKGEEIKEEVE